MRRESGRGGDGVGGYGVVGDFSQDGSRSDKTALNRQPRIKPSE